jgi:DNA-binding NarL/FixJ family response regulator
MHDDDATIRHGLEAGAHGCLLKSDSSSAHIETAIAALASNRLYFSPSLSATLSDVSARRWANSAPAHFTARELEVTQLIAEGGGNKDIARTLGISIKTVEAHRTAAMRKSGSRTASEFMRFATKHNLVRP